MNRALVAAAMGLTLAAGAQAQENAVAFVGAKIIPISGPEIDRGILIVEDGRITAVGAEAAMQLPADMDKVDVSGKVIMPGLVDSHSHIGEGSGADSSGPIQPEARILDALNVRDSGIQKAQAGGLTTVNVMPGSGHLLSGQTLYIKLRDGVVVDDLLIMRADGSIAGGVKMANGTNPRREENGFPGTRARAAALVRTQFVKAQDYRDKIRRAGSDPSKLPPRDLGLETLVDVLEGRRTVHFHTHRHDDIMTALRLADEFDFRIVLQHVTEGARVADEIAEAGAAASVILIDSPGGKLEAQNLLITTPGILEKAGVLVGLHTDDGITDSRLFLRSAGLAVRAGMSRQGALEALTIANARMLELEDRVGSLEPGKDADFIILSGDPMSVWTVVEETWVEGRRVFDRDDPQDLTWAVGGWGAGRDRTMHVHEGGVE